MLVGASSPPALVDTPALSLQSRADDTETLETVEDDAVDFDGGRPAKSGAWPEDGPTRPEEGEEGDGPAVVLDADEDRRRTRRKGTSRERGHKIAGIPALRYEPSTGPQFGALVQYVWRPPDTRFNKIGLLFLSHVSTKLLQDYSLELSLRDLLGFDEQFILSGLYIDDPVFPYVGTREPGSVTNEELVEYEYYQARVRTFGGSLFYFQPVWHTEHISKRIDQGGRLSALAGYRMEADVIDAYTGSFLSFDRPNADGTHRRGSLSAGVAWDGRDNEASPTNGGLHDLTLEAAGIWTGATSDWYRLNLTLRWYRPLYRDRLIFGTRLGGDALFGNQPLVTEGTFGGPFPMVGMGGTDVGRGFFRRRFIGDYKFFWTPEVRGTPVRFYVSRWTFDLGLNAFADLGYVFSDEDPAELDNFHVSGGGGVYLNWERFFVLRAEVAGSKEGIQFYLNAGHAF